MQRKGDAGAASLKKVPTDLLKERIAEELRVLDDKVHLAKLQVNNHRYADTWPMVDEVLGIASALQRTHLELRGRATRGR